MRENSEKWMELCAQAATEQDSRKLMALIDQITALLDGKQERLCTGFLAHEYAMC
jgi:hypothetical protein